MHAPGNAVRPSIGTLYSINGVPAPRLLARRALPAQGSGAPRGVAGASKGDDCGSAETGSVSQTAALGECHSVDSGKRPYPVGRPNLMRYDTAADAAVEELIALANHYCRFLAIPLSDLCSAQMLRERIRRGHADDAKYLQLSRMMLGTELHTFFPTPTNAPLYHALLHIDPPVVLDGAVKRPPGDAGRAHITTVPLGHSVEDLRSLRGVAWGGVPTRCRASVWRALCDYAPASSAAAPSAMRRKHKEYQDSVARYYRFAADCVKQHVALAVHTAPVDETPSVNSLQARLPSAFPSNSSWIFVSAAGRRRAEAPSSSSKSEFPPANGATEPVGAQWPGTESSSGSVQCYRLEIAVIPSLSSAERAILTQLALDLPRHSGALFHVPVTAAALTRCLFLWSLRHPAVGYVQGIDDIMAVFLYVFLGEAIRVHEVHILERDIRALKARLIAAIPSLDNVVLDSSRSREEAELSLVSFGSRSFSHVTGGPDGGAHQKAGESEAERRQELLRRVWCYQPVPLQASATAPVVPEATVIHDPTKAQEEACSENHASVRTGPSSTTLPLGGSSAGWMSNVRMASLHFDPPAEGKMPIVAVVPRRESGPFAICGTEVEDEISTGSVDRLAKQVVDLPTELLEGVEADTYWCGGRFLSWVQDNYYHGQPGIMSMLSQLNAVLRAADEPLMNHFDRESVFVTDCCFQWMHCFLARELPLHLVARLWDTYLAVGSEFTTLHVYVCAALVVSLRDELLEKPFDTIILWLKAPLATNRPLSLNPHENPQLENSLGGWTAGAMAAIMGRRDSSTPLRGDRTRLRTGDRQWLDELVAAAYQLKKLHPV